MSETLSLDSILQKKREAEAAVAAYGEKALKEEFRKFFDTHPECLAVRWRQFTPYFNDGDPCRFSVREFYVRTANTDEEVGDYEDGFESCWESDDSPDSWKATCRAVETLQNIDKDIYEAVFGDHVLVTATREGFEVEEYDHD